MSTSNRKAGGFTLLELMVTVAVVIILTLVAVPSFERFFERYRLRSAVDNTLDVFASARQGAVESDRNVNVKFGSSTTAWCVGAVEEPNPSTQGEAVPLSPDPCQCDTTPSGCSVGGQQLTAFHANRGVTINAGGTAVTFDSKNGTLDPLTSQSIDFTSSKGNFALTLRISPLGQARACVPANKPAIPGYYPC